ncbi:MAG: enoyl-CoA hydratase/isomerase family protein [Microscillaceae bacterium]|nr:enoyl-CoA hydratase/isomerase family protein [Microscillaceae bacterium]
MENLKYLKFEEQNGIAIITLNYPKVNGLIPELVTELRTSVHHCRYTDRIRCVVITAAGGFFSAGADVQTLLAAQDQIEVQVRKMAEVFHEALSIMMRMEKPVITAVNGFAAGAGFGLAIAGDIVIAAETAKFCLSYPNAGLSPDGASTYLLPRLIGLRRTIELAFTNRTLSAQESLEWNMVTQVVPDEQLLNTALGLAQKLAQGPTDAYGYIKKLMLLTYSNSLEEQTDFEKEGIAHQMSSYNGQEGIKAFMENATKF